MALMLLLALGPAGCATPVARPWPSDAAPTDLCWPDPPAPARVALVGELHGPLDLGARAGWWKRTTGWLTGGDETTTPWQRPTAVAVAENGDLAVADLAGTVDRVDRATRRHARWRGAGTNDFRTPVALAFVSNLLFVADSSLGRVFALDERGSLRFELADGLQRPTGLAADGGELVVVDAAAGTLHRFAADGRPVGCFGGAETSALNRPTHVAADGAGRLFVTDALNARVCVFDRTGRLERIIGRRGDGTGHFNRPKGVAAAPHGLVIVADALFETIQFFDREGRFLLPVGGPGPGPGEFWLPTGVAATRDGLIYVADSYNERVQVLRLLETTGHD